MRKQSDEILHTLFYFAHFDYPPTISEIFTFLRFRTTHGFLEKTITELERSGAVYIRASRVSLKKSSFKIFKTNCVYSYELSHSFKQILSFFTWIPMVKLLGISGSLSMQDADKDGDIDIFLVTKDQTLWITRFIVLVITRLLRLMHIHPAAKLCWNLIQEENSLALPPSKRNEYAAHEILQMKPLFNRARTYEIFLCKNQWVTEIFPNVHLNCTDINQNYRSSDKSIITNALNRLFRYFQMYWLNKKGFDVTEYDGQAWFIQDDNESKIPVKLKKIEE